MRSDSLLLIIEPNLVERALNRIFDALLPGGEVEGINQVKFR